MDPNRAQLMMIAGACIAGLVALLLVRRMLGVLRFSLKMVVLLAVVAAAAAAWWNTQRGTLTSPPSDVDYRSDAQPPTTLLR